ncbi:hypothetical protein [Bacillus sp. REN3]|nr:hypothetical protein [Bacillus sp. REN3]
MKKFEQPGNPGGIFALVVSYIHNAVGETRLGGGNRAAETK